MFGFVSWEPPFIMSKINNLEAVKVLVSMPLCHDTLY